MKNRKPKEQRSAEDLRAFKRERQAAARRSSSLEKSEFLEAMRLLGGVKHYR